MDKVSREGEPSNFNNSNRSVTQQAASSEKPSFQITPPAINLPKGGGAIRGIGEKFSANPVTGTGSMSVPIAVSPGRAGFGPQLSLSYDSGAGNGAFGLGWNIGLPSISRKTDKGLPQYQDDIESDVFLLSGAEDLVPVLGADATATIRVKQIDYKIRRYRPRIEGAFALIERWSEAGKPANTCWRTISRDNITTWFGRDTDSRISDPAEPQHIFQWLICQTHDDKGNVCVYKYVVENGFGVAHQAVWEFNRLENKTPANAQANRYLKRIQYGNDTPYLPTLDEQTSDTLPSNWMFEVVFDYGDHSGDFPTPTPDKTTQANPWPARTDAFSQHRAGFEIRTYRLCQRVLMFHHFPGVANVGANCLVRSTEFEYKLPTDLHLPAQPGYTTLHAVTHRSYQRNPDRDPINDPEYELRDMPPVSFSYSKPIVDTTIHTIKRDQLDNLPIGTQGPNYRWLDLDGEGLSGILAEHTGGWHYKPSWGDGSFGPMREVARVPALALAGSTHQFMDLDGNGALDVVEFDGDTPGFHERTPDADWKQHIPFAFLPNINWQDPNLRFVDLTGDGYADALITEQDVFTWYPALAKQGFADQRNNRIASDEDDGPRLVFADLTQTIFLADMGGDGLTDLVRIRNGEVCYWPNLGYGRFGRKVSLGNVPRFDRADLFDPARIRLTDIDGSGPIDIIYLGQDGAQLYFNRSGNSLSDAYVVALPIATENLAAVQVADLLGNGTACLVWNSHLPGDAGRPVYYIDLMGGALESAEAHRKHEKPHLLIAVDNHLGVTTHIEYTPSTRFYVQDRAAGTPWLTRLAFPVHCVSKVTVHDQWRKTTFASTYSYHHGYFDGEEREFRGFGRVEQVDTQAFTEAAVVNADSPFFTQDQTLYQAPIKTITWYHTGIADDRQKILGLFAQEYATARYAAEFSAAGFAEPSLVDPEIDIGTGAALSAEEWREAMRACKGMPLRQEVIELDAKALEQTGVHQPVRLFSAAQHNCHLRRVQARDTNRHAVFLALESESFTCHYELDLTTSPLDIDPRIAHSLNLRFDEWGNVLQSVAVVYPRRKTFTDTRLKLEEQACIRAVQAERHIAYNEARFTDALPASRLHHRLPLPCEVRTYELTGDDPNAGFKPSTAPYITLADFRAFELSDRLPNQGNKVVVARAYHEQPLTTHAHKRLVEHVRTLYWDDASITTPPTQALAFAKHGPRGLKYEDYKLALTDDLLDRVFRTSAALAGVTQDLLAWPAIPALGGQPAKSARGLLRDVNVSGYRDGQELGLSAGQYWMRSGTADFQTDAHLHFFLPERFIDAFSNVTTLRYDSRDLFIEASTDARGNEATVERFDYRVLAPFRMRDANHNISEIAFDIRGLPVASALLGKVKAGPTPGSEVSETGDGITKFSFADLNPTPSSVANFFTQLNFDENAARSWLGTATARFVYHFGEARNAAGTVTQWNVAPASACSVLRERHVSDSLVTPTNPSPLQIAIEYSDGGGQAFVKKQRAEPETSGGPLRWLTNGKTIHNNKGKPVLQFEPYFSNSAHRFEEPSAVGVSPVMFYDAAGRLVRTDMPDGTFSRVEFSPWFSRAFDANDTVLESQWYRERLTAAERGVDLTNASADEIAREQEKDIDANIADAEEKRAAKLAAMHANTPAETHLDSLGREVLAITHNRTPDLSQRPTPDLSLSDGKWVDEFAVTFTKLDAEGKPLWIRDARGNLVMQYITPTKSTRWVDEPNETLPMNSAPCYDIAGNLLFQHSMDAGDRWMLMDAAGKPMLAWDFNDRGRGTALEARLFRTDYDALHRPTAQWLAINGAAPSLVEAFAYCDTVAPQDSTGVISLSDAQARNLIGQAITHHDPSGLATVERISLSGQPAHITRRLVRPDADGGTGIVNWKIPNLGSLLDDETFHQITEYDALGRMTTHYNWHRDSVGVGESDRVAVYQPQYGERGNLKSEKLYVRAKKHTTNGEVSFEANGSAALKKDAIVGITYNAKGQKLTLKLGNDTLTTYDYDDQTFRLTALRTVRSNPPATMQDLRYVYDPVGNITFINDAAQEAVFFRNTIIRPEHHYVYDALYRLVEANGREHDIRNAPPVREDRWPVGDFPTNDQLRNYQQRYVYDEVGNFKEMSHTANGVGWTRHYQPELDSNQLQTTWMGGNTGDAVTYFHDTHGSMLNLNRRVLAPTPDDWGVKLQWDWRDMIHTFDLEGGGSARYQYGIDKQRTRKYITRNGGGTTEERIYLSGYELYRRRPSANGPVVEEIESLHLFEGEQRVLLVDDVIATDSNRPDQLTVKTQTLYRYQYGNHLGSVALELDHDADIISYEEFHPYGTSAYRLMKAAKEAPPKRYRYTGMERDEESGLSYHTARYYATWVGRWVSTDPKYLTDGHNVYGYVADNPTNYIDSSGRAKVKLKYVALGLGIAVLGLAAGVLIVSTAGLAAAPLAAAAGLTAESIATLGGAAALTMGAVGAVDVVKQAGEIATEREFGTNRPLEDEEYSMRLGAIVPNAVAAVFGLKGFKGGGISGGGEAIATGALVPSNAMVASGTSAIISELAQTTVKMSAEGGANETPSDVSKANQNRTNPDPGKREKLNELKRYEDGNRIVEKEGQYWHLADGITERMFSAIQKMDLVGDSLQNAAHWVAGQWGKLKPFSEAELNAIQAARASGDEKLASLLVAQSRGRWVEGQLKNLFPDLIWSGNGPDAFDPKTGISYEIHSGTLSNMDTHAERVGMATEVWRLISF